MAAVLKHVKQYFSVIENTILNIFHLKFPSGALAPALLNLPKLEQSEYKPKTLNELLKDSILWAVPKKRKTVEKRRSKKFGYPDGFYKLLVPKRNILVCTKCGSYHEAGLLCPTCYDKVKKETEEIQDAIQAKLGISPIESEVVVLYEGEKLRDDESYEGKQIIEMKKERPKIFSNNLLQRSTQGKSDKMDVATLINQITQQ